MEVENGMFVEENCLKDSCSTSMFVGGSTPHEVRGFTCAPRLARVGGEHRPCIRSTKRVARTPRGHRNPTLKKGCNGQESRVNDPIKTGRPKVSIVLNVLRLDHKRPNTKSPMCFFVF